MRKQLARRLTMRHCRRLILQLRRQPRFVAMQNDQLILPAIKPISSIDHLCRRRAMDKALRPQTVGRISPPPDSEHPLTPLDDMYDHSPSLDTFQIDGHFTAMQLQSESCRCEVSWNLAWRAGKNGFAILLNDWYVNGKSLVNLKYRVAVRSGERPKTRLHGGSPNESWWRCYLSESAQCAIGPRRLRRRLADRRPLRAARIRFHLERRASFRRLRDVPRRAAVPDLLRRPHQDDPAWIDGSRDAVA